VRGAAVAVAALALVPALAGCGGGGGSHPARTTATAPGAGSAAAAAPPALRFRACRDLAGMRCATLTVPLRRRGTEPRGRLRLAVAASSGPAPRGVLVALSGGPGQPGLPFAPRLRRRLAGGLRGYRLVVLDQRGTGAGALACPALQDEAGTSDLAVPSAGAVRACARRIGPSRDAYATADTVDDLETLRSALGAGRMTLLGVSYGVLVAERYALAHPDRVRGLVLDSVVPQAGAEVLYRVPLHATARVLRAVCREAARRCAGDPAADLHAVIGAHPELGPPLADTITALSIGVPQLGVIPPALHAARGGDLGTLRRLIRTVSAAQHAPPRFFSAGLHAATICADSPAPWGGPETPVAARHAALARVRRTLPARRAFPYTPAVVTGHGFAQACALWPPEAPPPAVPPARIAAPALLLAGDRDLSTPLEWARAQARAMADARLVVVPGAGHSIIGRETGDRGRRAVTAFLSRLR
jgi:pimeloyl-ACP methyl ester carboxylesterase